MLQKWSFVLIINALPDCSLHQHNPNAIVFTGYYTCKSTPHHTVQHKSQQNTMGRYCASPNRFSSASLKSCPWINFDTCDQSGDNYVFIHQICLNSSRDQFWRSLRNRLKLTAKIWWDEHICKLWQIHETSLHDPAAGNYETSHFGSIREFTWEWPRGKHDPHLANLKNTHPSSIPTLNGLSRGLEKILSDNMVQPWKVTSQSQDHRREARSRLETNVQPNTETLIKKNPTLQVCIKENLTWCR